MGEQIQKVTLRRRPSSVLVSERADISISTLNRVEKGDKNVSIMPFHNQHYNRILFHVEFGFQSLFEHIRNGKCYNFVEAVKRKLVDEDLSLLAK